MKTTAEIFRKTMPSIRKAGGLVVDTYCILPLEYERMLLFPSVCGRILMTGEGFAFDTKEEAEIHLKKWGKPNRITWHIPPEKYHFVPPSGIATDRDIAICKQAGFTLYRDLIYSSFFVVLSRGKGRHQEFLPGKLFSRHLQLIGNEACMVPEEAVGKIYMHLHYDFHPKYQLHDIATVLS
ncbi:hypothetical protein [Acidithiobacillus caldus]|uniref:Uncharacterized protein n=2 Tax=Acidithiobacillus caldus TaxID=33059 RepID=F9ZRX4_ACICS|nr:hypothetical protein [Acidithiobacillus caldus]AEK58758.1 hypothetical protein Atc_2110 [Acidithiobacillus caldus SM-1]OFC35535.1 hypothetical protein BAE29_15390 [Acidithiobacillus caldus]OFC36384.1 hypothetical protein BAE27_06290 [Acidithiobacillus caldus]OFC40450.1 hypothetical protein BAE28_00110 [Acidithiobacillus caldus]OFC62179.1 hypothetical protein BAE30_02710 [Acidithiobacillus caldus]